MAAAEGQDTRTATAGGGAHFTHLERGSGTPLVLLHG